MASEASGKPPKIDQLGCEKQCALELAGKGYLALEIAERTFKVLADVDATGGDIDCKLGRGEAQFFTNNGIDTVKDQAYLDRCVANKQRLCPNSLPDNNRGACFSDFYYMNQSIRAELEKCFAAFDCIALGICINETNYKFRPPCAPWLGPTGVDCQ
jgi:hypothetical protein